MLVPLHSLRNRYGLDHVFLMGLLALEDGDVAGHLLPTVNSELRYSPVREFFRAIVVYARIMLILQLLLKFVDDAQDALIQRLACLPHPVLGHLTPIEPLVHSVAVVVIHRRTRSLCLFLFLIYK